MKSKISYGIISTLISLVIAVSMIAIIYANISVNNKNVFGFRLFVVSTGSMKGSIEQGELIITKLVKAESLKVDDIITFISIDENIRGKVNTHRIVSINQGTFITKGDANTEEDTAPVTSNRIIGKVIFHSSFLGFIMRGLSKPINMLIFIFLPIAIMAITDIRRAKKKLQRALEKEREKNGSDENLEHESNSTNS